IIKKLRERKLKKKVRELPEIKANNSNKVIREYVLKKVRKTDCDVFAIAVEKERIFDYLFEVQDRLYNYLCGILLKEIRVSGERLIVTIDKKHTNTLVRENFNQYMKYKLMGSDANVKIYHKPSFSNQPLQVVDFVAWSINRKFNTNDDSYYRLIEDKIANKEEILLWNR
ncbi:MAG: DUF3800 domain-containing protein, partial [Promethearchaeota archaeon]